MSRTGPAQIGGYVLAGGKSSRMGTDKALVELGGKPLIAHAVAKLRAICVEAFILGSNQELAAYAPLVPDLHSGCGPLGGIEAALFHSQFDWNLLVPVDVPFLPERFLRAWVDRVVPDRAIRLAYFHVGGRAQPGVMLIRRDAKSSITAAIERGEYKLLPTLSAAASGSSLHVECVDAGQEHWFTNVNTPEELKMARSRLLDDEPLRGADIPGAS
jgi:molybdopterin-guanine dinucleotide biosynthesis protein A